MVKNLVKAASEFNIGTSSIVEHLQKKGFVIENKPNAKLSDEMYDELMKEFSSSLAVKEKAEQLIIGKASAAQTAKKETVPPPPPVSTPVHSVVEARVHKPVTPVQPTVPTPPVESPKADDGGISHRHTSESPRLKVVDKIDLEPKKKKKAEDEISPELPFKEIPTVADEPISKTPGKTEPIELDAPIEELLHRAETPQLKGLKIMGKIDTEKFDKVKKKKEEPEPESKITKPVASSDEDVRKKRKRKRKKVETVNQNPAVSAPGITNRPPARRDDVKEISQKEIDDQIRATMARLGGNTKSRRQKIRRDNRSRIREKIELEEQAQTTTEMQVTEFMTVSELASLLNVKPAQVIMTCMNLGVIVSINQRLDAEIIELVAEEFGH
jgi:translation initiation factor IF-2